MDLRSGNHFRNWGEVSGGQLNVKSIKQMWFCRRSNSSSSPSSFSLLKHFSNMKMIRVARHRSFGLWWWGQILFFFFFFNEFAQNQLHSWIPPLLTLIILTSISEKQRSFIVMTKMDTTTWKRFCLLLVQFELKWIYTNSNIEKTEIWPVIY